MATRTVDVVDRAITAATVKLKRGTGSLTSGTRDTAAGKAPAFNVDSS